MPQADPGFSQVDLKIFSRNFANGLSECSLVSKSHLRVLEACTFIAFNHALSYFPGTLSEKNSTCVSLDTSLQNVSKVLSIILVQINLYVVTGCSF